ncbi:MAG: ABC transporter ATP-binding protein [Intestinibacter bartlettii]|uniref:ABC transporter ATP-binding protein n=1 Tax=Intestinibacter bartlettii TaxID=261299 RepID=UPI0026F0E36F|nr:ABC transporter ATP-binding protein [Intestinibacter bartlettii]MDO5009579.1 ABC transporter ATP-binding protein [Intestinibacter bartlettii]
MSKENKEQSTKYILKRMSKYLYKYKFTIIISIILTIVSNIFALVGPMLSGYAIEVIEKGKGNIDFSKIFYYAFLMIVFYICSSILSYIISIIMVKTARNVVYSLRKDAFDTLLNLPLSYFDKNSIGDVLSKITYDIDTMGSTLSTDLINILTSIVTLVGSFFMMFTISKKLVLIFFITIPMSVISTKYITNKTRPLFRKRAKKIGDLNGFVEENISGLKIIKAYNKESKTIDEFRTINKNAVDAYYNAEYYGSMTVALISFINNISLAFISTIGSILYLKNEMSLGQISSFVLYSRKFSGPIREISNLISDMQSSFAASERVFRFIDEKREEDDKVDAVKLEKVHGKIDMQNVNFSYDLNEKVLENLNISAKPNTVVAIVGPTGCGKTTIINLLMKFYNRDDGQILVDDKNIDDITKKSMRQAYAMVLQDTWLFEGSIYENIAYGNEDATLEDVKRVAKLAQIDDFIEKLPNGYDTIISGNGDNISKGQKQLINIARAMLIDAKMLILDEATSNIDSKTEIQIQNALLEIMKGKTCFIIAHRLSTIKNADQILVLNNGKIIEQGKHEELLEEDGFYANLFKSQF